MTNISENTDSEDEDLSDLAITVAADLVKAASDLQILILKMHASIVQTRSYNTSLLEEVQEAIARNGEKSD